MNLVKRFLVNEVGRDLAVGDIHGHFPLLERLLESVSFNPEVDRLFSVGDLVDRGPQSDRFVEFLDKPWFHAVRGNHDQFMLTGEMRPSLRVHNGGAWFVCLPELEKVELRLSAGTLPVAIEVQTKNGTVGIVHADVPFNDWGKFTTAIEGDWNSRLIQFATWNRDRWHGFNSQVEGIDTVVVGHCAFDDIVKLDNVIGIDTGCGYEGGKLTLLDLNTLEVAAQMECAVNSVPDPWGR